MGKNACFSRMHFCVSYLRILIMLTEASVAEENGKSQKWSADSALQTLRVSCDSEVVVYGVVRFPWIYPSHLPWTDIQDILSISMVDLSSGRSRVLKLIGRARQGKKRIRKSSFHARYIRQKESVIRIDWYQWRRMQQDPLCKVVLASVSLHQTKVNYFCDRTSSYSDAKKGDGKEVLGVCPQWMQSLLPHWLDE